MATPSLVRTPRRGLGLLGALLAWSTGALAAPPAADAFPDRTKPMQIVVMRDATPGCAPCAEWIAAQGKIVAGSRAAFERVLRSLGKRRLPVFIDSPGGSVLDAMAMGDRIRALHLDVVVTRSALEPCDGGCGSPARPQPGHAHGIGALCASACVLVLAAGVKREAAPWTVVGVHQMLSERTRTEVKRVFRVLRRQSDGVEIERTLVSERPVWTTRIKVATSDRTYDEVAAYLARMGVGPALMPLMRATPSSGLHRVTVEEARDTALVTDTVDGEYRIDQARALPGPSAAAKSLPEQAFLVMTETGSAKPKVMVGRVTWSLDHAGPMLTLRADVVVPDAGVDAVLRLSGGETGTLVLAVSVATGATGSFRAVTRFGGLQARTVSPRQVSPLPGTTLVNKPNALQLLLAGNPRVLAADRRLLEERPWLDLGLEVDGGIRATLNLEHGLSGTPLIKQAFAAWVDTPTAAAKPAP